MFLTGGNHSPLCSICGSSFPIAFHISPPPVPLPATFTSPYSLSFPPMFHGNVLLTDCTGSWVSQNQTDPIPLPFSLIGIISFSPPNGKTALPHPGTAAVSHPLNGSPLPVHFP